MDLEPPPQDLHAKLYDLQGVTERERIEQSTTRRPCAGCHKIINPLGFFQESWDASAATARPTTAIPSTPRS